MKQLRVTASEIILRGMLPHESAFKIIELLEEIKRQTYFDGAEDMLQSLEGHGAKVERTRAMQQLEMLKASPGEDIRK